MSGAKRLCLLALVMITSLFSILACATPNTPEPSVNPIMPTPTISAATTPAQIADQPTPAPLQEPPPAFPGAEGFGATATGGRGGQVLYVTTLDPDPRGEIPGSLNWALRQAGPRYILFQVSGVIDGYANIVNGDVTIAGQTSPGGIIVRGIVCDGRYERNQCNNLIIRHIRSRPAFHVDGNGNALDDALRLDGLEQFIIDHSSFAHASDEVVQLSWARRGTIQNSIFAETVGDHASLGGMLLNYSALHHPQDYLSIHHNLWFRLGGGLPEITCEASGYPDEPADISGCQAHPLRLELSNNLLWAPGINIWYNREIGGNAANGDYILHLNWVNNYLVAPPTFSFGMILRSVLEVPQNRLYMAGNRMNLYPDYADDELAYCCNDFSQDGKHPNTDPGVAQRLSERHPFPPITYTATQDLPAYMVANVGAFPRDPMDQRFLAAVVSGQTEFGIGFEQPGANDAFALLFDPNAPPPAPLDTDGDGMPDDWEMRHGLNPNMPDHNGTELSLALTGRAGYTNLECYLNELADLLVSNAAQQQAP